MTRIELGKLLTQERERRGMSRYMLAKATSLGDGQIRAIEDGSKAYTVDTLLKVCTIVGIELSPRNFEERIVHLTNQDIAFELANDIENDKMDWTQFRKVVQEIRPDHLSYILPEKLILLGTTIPPRYPLPSEEMSWIADQLRRYFREPIGNNTVDKMKNQVYTRLHEAVIKIPELRAFFQRVIAERPTSELSEWLINENWNVHADLAIVPLALPRVQFHSDNDWHEIKLYELVELIGRLN